MIGLIIGLSLGTIFGFVLAALLISGAADEEKDKPVQFTGSEKWWIDE